MSPNFYSDSICIVNTFRLTSDCGNVERTFLVVYMPVIVFNGVCETAIRELRNSAAHRSSILIDADDDTVENGMNCFLVEASGTIFLEERRCNGTG